MFLTAGALNQEFKSGAIEGASCIKNSIGALSSSRIKLQEFAELNEQSIADYNASLLSGGMEDKGARRDAIYKIFLRNGYEEERINTMLDTYGYAQGGIAGLRSGYDEGGTVTITQKEYDRLTKGIEFKRRFRFCFRRFKHVK